MDWEWWLKELATWKEPVKDALAVIGLVLTIFNLLIVGPIRRLIAWWRDKAKAAENRQHFNPSHSDGRSLLANQ